MSQNPIATITMESGIKIIIELIPKEAPNTVRSFINLANGGNFDKHAIERIVPGYVVDASYRAFSKEVCKYLMKNESRNHGFPNHIKVEPGVIAMGGYGEDGIAGGEFFFPLQYHEKLDGNYPAFGIIREGLEEILRWETVALKPVPYPENPDIQINEPEQPIVIASIRVETFGIDYPSPEKLPMKNRPPSW